MMVQEVGSQEPGYQRANFKIGKLVLYNSRQPIQSSQGNLRRKQVKRKGQGKDIMGSSEEKDKNLCHALYNSFP